MTSGNRRYRKINCRVMPVSTRYADTTPQAMEVLLDLHRKMPASRKVASVFEWSETLFRLSLANVRQQYPEATDREVFLRMAARHLDRDLMIRAYGWHPDLGTK